MRPYVIEKSSGLVLHGRQLDPGSAAPENHKLQYIPRIKCFDCPGKLYTAEPGCVIEDFRVHLGNRKHKENLERRMEKEADLLIREGEETIE